MNREIKLRAWDKIDKKMYYHVGISLNGVQIYEDDTFPEKLILDRGMDCFDLSLWTGLYDKHNNPIYEGDICEWQNTRSGDKQLSDVYFNNQEGKFCFRWYDGEYMINIERKVVGNIFENTELVELILKTPRPIEVENVRYKNDFDFYMNVILNNKLDKNKVISYIYSEGAESADEL
jgi:hypothetical protein